jgi:hypothetical protein
MTTSVEALDGRIGRVERWLDLAALLGGAVLLLVVPTAQITVYASTLVLAGGLALLGSGLIRDLVWLALSGRPVATAPAGPAEVRTCLESALGALAVASGLVWRLLAPGPPWSIGLGLFILVLALAATFGHLARNVIITFRVDPGHRNMPFWS